MRNVPALTWREIISIFFSPLAYVVLTIFLFFSGFFFYWIAADTRRASMTDLTGVLTFLFLVAIPFLTMRTLSEEFRSGAIESLLTAPVTETEIIVSKFLGTMAFFLAMLLPSLAYVAVLFWLGRPEAGPIVSGYVGLLLLGAYATALGVFCSALTRSQIVAGTLALILLLSFWVCGAAGEALAGPFAPVLSYIGTLPHLDSFSNGQMAFRDAFYFLSLAVFWLFLAVRVLENRRWR